MCATTPASLARTVSHHVHAGRAGPAGCYTTDGLLRQKTVPGLSIEVDLFERLPSPHGLVRSGVAPDHQSIKKVQKAFERIISDARTRYFGNVHVGTDITHAE